MIFVFALVFARTQAASVLQRSRRPWLQQGDMHMTSGRLQQGGCAHSGVQTHCSGSEPLWSGVIGAKPLKLLFACGAKIISLCVIYTVGHKNVEVIFLG